MYLSLRKVRLSTCTCPVLYVCIIMFGGMKVLFVVTYIHVFLYHTLAHFSDVAISNNWSMFIEAIARTLSAIRPQKKVLLLYNIHDPGVNLNMSLLSETLQHSFVIALTSRESVFSTASNSNVIRTFCSVAKRLSYKVFTDDQILTALRLVKKEETVTVKYSSLSSPVAVLMYLVNDPDIYKRMKANFSRYLKSCNVTEFFTVKEILCSIYFMKRIGEKLNDEDKMYFKSCFAVQVQLLFLNDDDVIIMSYIPFYLELMEFILRFKPDVHTFCQADVRFANAVKGQRLEELFFNDVQVFNLTMYRSRLLYKGSSTLPEGVTLKVKVDHRVWLKGDTQLSELKQNTLYILEPRHPSIDAVLCDPKYLFLIQVSTTEYRDHKTKASSLKKAYKNSTVLGYYQNLCQSLKPVYAYLSTAGPPTAREINRASNVSFAVIAKDSSMDALFITFSDRIKMPISYH